MWLLLEWIASGEALELAWWLLQLLDGARLLNHVSVEGNTPIAFIKPRPWWPKTSKPKA